MKITTTVAVESRGRPYVRKTNQRHLYTFTWNGVFMAGLRLAKADLSLGGQPNVRTKTQEMHYCSTKAGKLEGIYLTTEDRLFEIYVCDCPHCCRTLSNKRNKTAQQRSNAIPTQFCGTKPDSSKACQGLLRKNCK